MYVNQCITRYVFIFWLCCGLAFGAVAPALASTDPEDPACTDPNGESCYLVGFDLRVTFPHSALLILLIGTLAVFVFVRIVIRIWDLVGI